MRRQRIERRRSLARGAPRNLGVGAHGRRGDQVEWQRHNMKMGLIDTAASQAALRATAMLKEIHLSVLIDELICDTDRDRIELLAFPGIGLRQI